MSYRQRVFWLRNNESFEDEDDNDYYLHHFKEDNRSLWCELEKRSPTYEVMSVPVRALRFTNQSSERRPEWYPHETPYGGMLLLQIKRVL